MKTRIETIIVTLSNEEAVSLLIDLEKLDFEARSQAADDLIQELREVFN